MARKKRSTLPPITEADLTLSPERIRPTANGWAWKCEYCGQFASSETLAGKYVCRSHGGVTPRQRDPVAHHQAKQNRKPVPRPPGRPPKTGRWSRRDLLRVDEIFQDYKARRLDPDDTNDDLLYLRAMLECQREDLNTFSSTETLLLIVQARLQEYMHSEEAPDLETVQALRELLREANTVLAKRLVLSKRVEKGHERIVKLAKIRADTRIKNSAAQQVGAFMLMMERLTTIFEETLPPDLYLALQLRFDKELKDVPRVI